MEEKFLKRAWDVAIHGVKGFVLEHRASIAEQSLHKLAPDSPLRPLRESRVHKLQREIDAHNATAPRLWPSSNKGTLHRKLETL
jgi:hypothetical protein